MIRFIFLVACIFGMGRSHCDAQSSSLLKQGIIYFKKTVNNHAQFELMFDTKNPKSKRVYENFVNITDKFESFDFQLEYTNGKTLYQPVSYIESKNILSEITSRNTVYTDFERHESISQVNIFEKLFLVKDSLTRTKWKVTDETRTIAGFECRRANGLICDSIYVVAFYTLEIATNGGPEHFSGLPGMILGISLPQDHVSWFATAVEKKNVSRPLSPSLKGEATDKKKLSEAIKSINRQKLAINELFYDRILCF